jgi:hypothetical protein
MYYENNNDFDLQVDGFKCYFEIHVDVAYISHTFPDIKLG